MGGPCVGEILGAFLLTKSGVYYMEGVTGEDKAFYNRGRYNQHRNHIGLKGGHENNGGWVILTVGSLRWGAGDGIIHDA